MVIPRVEKIFLAKSGRENLGRGEEHVEVNWPKNQHFIEPQAPNADIVEDAHFDGLDLDLE